MDSPSEDAIKIAVKKEYEEILGTYEKESKESKESKQEACGIKFLKNQEINDRFNDLFEKSGEDLLSC